MKDRAVILFDHSITPELKAFLADHGDSAGGRKLLKLGHALEQAGMADQLQLLLQLEHTAQMDPLERVAKAVEMVRLLRRPPTQPTAQPKAKPEPEPEPEPKPKHEPEPKPQPKQPTVSAFAAGRL